MTNFGPILYLVAGVLLGLVAASQLKASSGGLTGGGAVPNWQMGVSQTKDASVSAWRMNSHTGRMEQCTVNNGKAICILMPNLP